MSVTYEAICSANVKPRISRMVRSREWKALWNLGGKVPQNQWLAGPTQPLSGTSWSVWVITFCLSTHPLGPSFKGTRIQLQELPSEEMLQMEPCKLPQTKLQHAGMWPEDAHPPYNTEVVFAFCYHVGRSCVERRPTDQKDETSYGL